MFAGVAEEYTADLRAEGAERAEIGGHCVAGGGVHHDAAEVWVAVERVRGAGTIRTFCQSASSSSARISGNEVIEPCPISVAGDMRVIVPSSEMLTQGLSALPVRAPASVAAPARHWRRALLRR